MLRYQNGESVYEIKIENPDHVSSGVVSIELDGEKLETDFISLESGEGIHIVHVRMGE